MNLRKKLVWQLLLPLLALATLFAVLALDLPLFHPPDALLEVSVLLRETDSSTLSAARQGMEQAAVDFGAELRFLSLSAANSADEQSTLLTRETDGGADAILLLPADPAALADAVKQASAKTAVVTLESDMASHGASACISVDNAALGEALGRAVLNGVPAGGEVILLDSAPSSTGISARLDAAMEVLEAEGRRTYHCTVPPGDSVSEALTQTLAQRRPGAIVAFEATALEAAAKAAQEAGARPLVYGMGATTAIAAYLEQSYITAIVAQNEFAAGYLAVEAAVTAARRRPQPAPPPLEFSTVRQENMYDDDSQKLLFPVTR